MRLAVLFLVPLFFAGAPPQQTPVFRGSTNVVVVDVQITDGAGVPIEGLTPADFSLTVDGKPRAISSVEFRRLSQGAAVAAPNAFSTLASPDPVRSESSVLFVVDPANMAVATSRATLDQAADFMATMSPAYAVGLLVVPAKSPQFPFSPMRARMAAALRNQVGLINGYRSPIEIRSQGIIAADGIEAGIAVLKRLDGRRTLVYVADSLGLSLVNIDRVVKSAMEADVRIYVVSAFQPVSIDVSDRTSDASTRFKPKSMGDPVEAEAAVQLADRTGGWYYERKSGPIFPRLERALSAQYLLSFDVESSDKNGKPHKIGVKVNRSGADLQFRKEFVR